MIKGLFAWAGKYQRTPERINPRTLLSDMRAFILGGGSDRPIGLGLGQPVAPLWGVGWGTGQKEGGGSGTEPESWGRLGRLEERVKPGWGAWWGAARQA